ncbi:homoserine kinase [Derxia gummosa]|uniref:Homoserine kinase n=1 Tax=Derxia gummosa DSM 723 TaxID=1121388 RepID=A0A8B6X1V1_9BURK|nr:homoserine kinase [Derxia gummosa]
MAVFTPVSPAEAADWLRQYDLGELVSIEGIGSGIENSNFFFNTTSADNGGRFVLTIFENLEPAQLPFYLEFMAALAARGVAVPRPIPDRTGAILQSIKGKPCCLATRLKGEFELDPQPEHCRQLGRTIAQMHAGGLAYQEARPQLMQPNLRGLDWQQAMLPKVAEWLPADLADLLRDELAVQAGHQSGAQYASLPRGPVHADIFRNNVLFDGTRAAPHLGGVFDFYFAGVDSFIFDLAVAVNDWAIDLDSGAIDAARADALIAAYAAERPFTDAERAAWPLALRAGALRFWVSRLYDFYRPREAETLTPHDPTHFERILRLRRAGPGCALP